MSRIPSVINMLIEHEVKSDALLQGHGYAAVFLLPRRFLFSFPVFFHSVGHITGIVGLTAFSRLPPAGILIWTWEGDRVNEVKVFVQCL